MSEYVDGDALGLNDYVDPEELGLTGARDEVTSVPAGYGAEDYNLSDVRANVRSGIRDAAPDIGAAIGGIVGARAGRGLGAYPGTIAGTAAGFATQRALQPEGQERPWSQFPAEAAKQTALQGFGDLAQWSLVKLGNKFLKAKPEHIYPDAEEAFKTSKEWGAPLTPAQVTRVGAGSSLESISRATFLGKGPVNTRYQEQSEVLVKKMDELFNQYGGGDRYDLSKKVTEHIAEGEKAFRDMAKQDYANLDAMTAGLKKTRQVSSPSTILGPTGQPINVTTTVTDNKIVDMAPVKKQAAAAADMFELKSPVETVLRQVQEAGDNMSFTEAHTLRSDLLSVMRKMPESSSKRVRAATMVKEALEQRMEDAAKQGGGQVWKEYRRISDSYREGMETFNNKTILKLAEDEPLALYNSYIKPGNVDTIADIKKAVFSNKRGGQTANELWGKVQDAYLHGLLVDSGMKGDALMSNFRDLDKLATMKRLLDPDKYDTLKKFAQFAEASNRKAPSAGVLVSILQAGAIGGILYGQDSALGAGSLAILMAPRSMAKLVTNPKFVAAIQAGAKAKPGSKGFTNAIRAASVIRDEVHKQTGEEVPPPESLEQRATDWQQKREPVAPLPGRLNEVGMQNSVARLPNNQEQSLVRAKQNLVAIMTELQKMPANDPRRKILLEEASKNNKVLNTNRK